LAENDREISGPRGQVRQPADLQQLWTHENQINVGQVPAKGSYDSPAVYAPSRPTSFGLVHDMDPNTAIKTEFTNTAGPPVSSASLRVAILEELIGKTSPTLFGRRFNEASIGTGFQRSIESAAAWTRTGANPLWKASESNALVFRDIALQVAMLYIYDRNDAESWVDRYVIACMPDRIETGQMGQGGRKFRSRFVRNEVAKDLAINIAAATFFAIAVLGVQKFINFTRASPPAYVNSSLSMERSGMQTALTDLSTSEDGATWALFQKKVSYSNGECSWHRTIVRRERGREREFPIPDDEFQGASSLDKHGLSNPRPPYLGTNVVLLDPLKSTFVNPKGDRSSDLVYAPTEALYFNETKPGLGDNLGVPICNTKIVGTVRFRSQVVASVTGDRVFRVDKRQSPDGRVEVTAIIGANGELLATSVTPDDRTSIGGRLPDIVDLASNLQNVVYVLHSGGTAVTEILRDGSTKALITGRGTATTGNALGLRIRAHSIAIDRAGNVYLSDGASRSIIAVDRFGRSNLVLKPDTAPLRKRSSHRLSDPGPMAIASNGDLLIGDIKDNEIWRLRDPAIAGEAATDESAFGSVLTPAIQPLKIHVDHWCYCDVGPRDYAQVKVKVRIGNTSRQEVDLALDDFRLVIAYPEVAPVQIVMPTVERAKVNLIPKGSWPSDEWLASGTRTVELEKIVAPAGLGSVNVVSVPPTPAKIRESYGPDADQTTFASSELNMVLAPGSVFKDERRGFGDVVFYIPVGTGKDFAAPTILGLLIESPDGASFSPFSLWDGGAPPQSF
jgi:hypothetical protein